MVSKMEKTKTKQERASLVEIIGFHLRRYWILMTIILSFVVLGHIAFVVAWIVSPDNVPLYKEVTFHISEGFLILTTIVGVVMLILCRKNKVNAKVLAIYFHAYSFVLMVVGTIGFVFDVSLGFPEIVYLMFATLIAGLFVVEPIFFSILSTTSVIAVIVTSILNDELLHHGVYLFENIINIFCFILLVIAISYRNYQVVISEYKASGRLRKLTYVDQLTGLLNERSYIKEVESLDNKIKNGEEVNYAVILMDVNNLKATNDAYGHRYGCSLIVRTGRVLPEIFKTSKLFHVGGDEFIVIVYDKDYDNFEEVMKNFDEKMLYSLVTYEGVELIFSVARGYCKHEKGKLYKDALQVADKAMYENKTYLKEKYHMKGR